MTSHTFARMGAIPTSARAVLKVSSPKPILKRPIPLPLSPGPFPFSASFSIHISPANSPHVHFPPSPCLASTYSTHSPNTYDRAPISVSPNPLAMPKWGDRVYSPTLDGFKLADPPKPIPLVVIRYDTPTSTGPQDPRSPKPNPKASKRIEGEGVRFAELPNKPARNPTELGKALSSYPRSPYPSAPISPVDFGPSAETAQLHGKGAGRRTRSFSEAKAKRPMQCRPTIGFRPTPSPLGNGDSGAGVEQLDQDGRESKIPLEEGTMTSAEEGATSLTGGSCRSAGLSQAFWQSVSLIETESDLEGEVMTSHPMMFATRDGTIQSFPAMTSSPQTVDFDLLSPGINKSSFTFSKSLIASPSPSDLTAAFPTFSTVLASGNDQHGSHRLPELAYPPRAQLWDKPGAVRRPRAVENAMLFV